MKEEKKLAKMKLERLEERKLDYEEDLEEINTEIKAWKSILESD